MPQTMNTSGTERRPNYPLRRAVVGVVALAAAGLSVELSAHIWDAAQAARQHAGYVQNPDTIPAGEYDEYVVKPADTPTGIAEQFVSPVDDPRELITEIENQRDGDFLEPGQVVKIEKRLEDVSPAAPNDISGIPGAVPGPSAG
jgi:hypothetical protein